MFPFPAALIDLTSFRVALRTLGRHRGFTVVAVSSLAIAIALNTTMYSVLDAMLDPRINARSPDHLYAVHYYGSYKHYRDIRDAELRDRTVEHALRAGLTHLGSATGVRLSFDLSRDPLVELGDRFRRLSPSLVQVVRPNYFDVLGSTPREGRTFRESDERDASTVVISDRLADYFFPGQPAVGKSLTLDGHGFTIIGVVERNDVFQPLTGDFWRLRPAGARSVPINLLRLNRRVDPKDVQKELAVIAARLALQAGDPAGTSRFVSQSFATIRFKLGKFHLALIGAVAAVLLVACANLANLQLARGIARARELAVRAAVGANRRQLVGHLLLESALLSAAGMILGLLLTLWGSYIVKATVPPVMAEYMLAPQTSWKMFLFAAFAALVCLFLAGLLPALRVSRVDPETLLKAGAGTGANRRHRRRYGAMVIAQIGFALPVLIAAVIVFRAAVTLHRNDHFVMQRGFDASPLIVSNILWSPDSGKARVVPVNDMASALIARARSVRGVLEATIELRRAPVRRRVMVDDENGYVREEPAPQWSYDIVSPRYFRVFGQHIERGRDFADGEFDGRSVIMDAPSARFLWGNRNPIGRSIKFGDAKSDVPWHTVVGILGDARDTVAIRRANPTANYRLNGVYRAVTPTDTLTVGTNRWQSMTFYARVDGNTELAAVRIQRAFRTMAELENPGVAPLEERWGVLETRTRQDFVAGLFGAFALVAIGLVALGVYGIVAHSVAERRRELAVRISLGATARNILHSVLREGNVLILSGVALGLLLTKDQIWWLGQFLVDENAGYDAPFMALIAAGLFAIAVLAAFYPAWRATRIDPIEALRHE